MRIREEEIQLMVKMAQRGKRRGMERLYELFVEPVFRYVYLRVGNWEEAEDLTSRIFIKVFKKIKSYRERGIPFSAWLFRVAHNEIVDHYRTKGPVCKSFEEIYENPVSSESDPERVILEEETRKKILEALTKLTPDQREVIVLRYLQEFSISEIAKIMDRSETAIRSLLQRALRRLNKVLLSGGEEEEAKIYLFKTVS